MSTEDNSPSIEEQVNNVVAQFGEDGKLPADLDVDPAIKFAAVAEKRRRDTQSAYTKTNQEAKRLAAENAELAKSWEQDATSTLSVSEQTELEELKSQDPDAWRTRINEIETNKKAAFGTKRAEIADKASELTELELREQQLNAYNEANPEHQLTDDVIENDIPPRITKQLASGEITFDDFLAKCQTFMTKGKVIKSTTPDLVDDPNLDSVPGGKMPSEESRLKHDAVEYKDSIF